MINEGVYEVFKNCIYFYHNTESQLQILYKVIEKLLANKLRLVLRFLVSETKQAEQLLKSQKNSFEN